MGVPIVARASWVILLSAAACSSEDASVAPPPATSPADAAAAATDGGESRDPLDASPTFDAKADAPSALVPPDPSAACGGDASVYPAGATTLGQLALSTPRTFRVHVPPGYDGRAPRPLVLMFHGGGGSGKQLEQASADLDPIADREGFVAVYPDGTGTLRSWNGGGCCAYAVANDVDDVGFVGQLLDHLEATLCLDRRRVFASGMSNGAILTQRLACELAGRIAAVAPVSGTDMTASCAPSRPVALMEIHGTADGHVPWDGGVGCGPTDVSFTSVPTTIERWRTRNGCQPSTVRTFSQGDGHCDTQQGCRGGADVTLCTMVGDGHSWPGGQPPADLTACPGNGPQSSTFHASEAIWSFFAAHPRE